MTRPPDGWVAVSCAVSDVLRSSEHTTVLSSKTDLHGTYGKPEVFTEWGVPVDGADPVPVLREHTWPDGAPCEHFVPARLPDAEPTPWPAPTGATS